MSSANKGKEGNIEFGKLIAGFCLLIVKVLSPALKGLRKIKYQNPYTYILLFCWYMASIGIVYFRFAHLRFLHLVAGDLFTVEILTYFARLGKGFNAMFVFLFGVFLFLTLLGAIDIVRIAIFQRAINTLGIKNKNGDVPKVKKVISLDESRSLLVISSPGFAPCEWEKKKNNLAFEFRQSIDKIVTSKDKRFVNIYLTKNELPKSVSYFDYEDSLTKPYSFIVGESSSGLVSESLGDSLPHILMGGATGMGKSTAFKLMIYSLLKSSPPKRIKMILLDLKKGVEVADFQAFPNVEIAKDEEQAVSWLEFVVKEMNSRYEFLEKEKLKKIVPSDKMPMIVIAVDEASVLFGKTQVNSSHKELIEQARELTTSIAKLGRASSIHLILSTQRATKTSIDTATQDNLEGRLCFRTKSVSGSTAILGNKAAMELPNIPGRAFWSKGSKVIKVQVPFMDEAELSEECKLLAKEHAKVLKASTNEQMFDNDNSEFNLKNKQAR